MPLVEFDEGIASDLGRDERVLLARFDGRLAAVLVCLSKRNRSSENRWYLESGFGPCSREGLIFKSRAQIAVWIRDQFRTATT